MTDPRRFLNRVWLFLAAALLVAAAVHDILLGAFLHNPALNGLILGVLAVGIAYTVRRILVLGREIRWIAAFEQGRITAGREGPRLLGPLAALLAESGNGTRALSPLSVRYFLDGIAARLDESRDITRYQTGLLIFLGLLGTFWGLLRTIEAVAGVIADLELGTADLAAVFEDLKAGLASPLSGMGTAFSSSLFGLAGSLVLGFVDLQATQAQNAFYNEVEEWLSGLVRHDTAPAAGTGAVAVREERRRAAVPAQGEPVPTYVQALLEQTAENLERLEHAQRRSEAARGELVRQLGALTEALAALDDRLRRDQQILSRLVETQKAVGERLERGIVAVDDELRRHLRSIDARLGQLLEETVRGREISTRELRDEIRVLTRTVAIAAGEPQALPGE